jgi:hypothetical protein
VTVKSNSSIEPLTIHPGWTGFIIGTVDSTPCYWRTMCHSDEGGISSFPGALYQ